MVFPLPGSGKKVSFSTHKVRGSQGKSGNYFLGNAYKPCTANCTYPLLLSKVAAENY